jgi:hypothetical protein
VSQVAPALHAPSQHPERHSSVPRICRYRCSGHQSQEQQRRGLQAGRCTGRLRSQFSTRVRPTATNKAFGGVEAECRRGATPAGPSWPLDRTINSFTPRLSYRKLARLSGRARAVEAAKLAYHLRLVHRPAQPPIETRQMLICVPLFPQAGPDRFEVEHPVHEQGRRDPSTHRLHPPARLARTDS